MNEKTPVTDPIEQFELDPFLVKIWEQVAPTQLVNRSPAHILFVSDEQLREAILRYIDPPRTTLKIGITHWFPFQPAEELKIPGVKSEVLQSQRPYYYLELTPEELGPKIIELSKNYDVMVINLYGIQPTLCLDQRGRRFRQR